MNNYSVFDFINEYDFLCRHSKYPVLNGENILLTNKKYFELYNKDKSRKYEEIIFEKNLGIIYDMGTKYFDYYGDLENYLSILCEGLLKAIKSFDVTKNIKFSTYAYSTIKIVLKNEYGKQHSKKFLATKNYENYCDDFFDEEKETDLTAFKKIIQTSPEDIIINKYALHDLKILIQNLDLSEKDKQIFNDFYGNGNRSLSIVQISKKLNCTPANVGRRLKIVIEKIKKDPKLYEEFKHTLICIKNYNEKSEKDSNMEM